MINRILTSFTANTASLAVSTAGTVISLIKVGNSYQGYKNHLSALDTIKIEVDKSLEKTNAFVTSLKMNNTQPLLNLYSMKDSKTILKMETNIEEIFSQQNHLLYLTQQLNWVEQTIEKVNLIEKELYKSLKTKIRQIQNQIILGQYLLNMSEFYCKTYLYRLQSKFIFANQSVVKWIGEIQAYKNYLNKYHLSYSEEVIHEYLVNAYNHKAKIHRALAGFDYPTLDTNQLSLSFESYEKALAINKNKDILNCLGFFCNDMSDVEALQQNRKSLIELSLNYHLQSLEIDNQDPNVYHGLGYAIYKLQKYRSESGQAIDKDKLRHALSLLSFSQQKNPNSRLCLDKGLIYLLLAEDENTLKNFNQGLIIDTNHKLLRYYRGCLFLKKGHVVSALEDLRYGRAISIHSETLKNLFDDAITRATKSLTQEHKCPEQPKTDPLDVRIKAKQAAFTDTLRECAQYAMILQRNSSVFISYAWAESTHLNYNAQLIHVQRVEQLAKELEIAGIKVYLDVWEDTKGVNPSKFIEKIHEASHILVIGTHHYLEKCRRSVNDENISEPVLKLENDSISYLMRHNDTKRNKIIPILLEGVKETSLPPMLRSKTPVDFVTYNYHKEIFKLIGAIYQFPVRDEAFEKIIKNFEAVVVAIDGNMPKELAEKYSSSIHALFQTEMMYRKKAQEMILAAVEEKASETEITAVSLRSKL